MPNPSVLKQALAAAILLRDGNKPAGIRRQIAKNRLQRVLVEAGRHVPFYRDLFRDLGYNPETDYRGFGDLQLLPIVNKGLIRSQYDRFRHEGFEEHQLYAGHTSGTTGSPFRVTYDMTGRSIRVASWIRVMMQNGYSPGDKALALSLPSNVVNTPSLIQRLGFMRRQAIDCTLSIRTQADLLLEYRPDVVYGNRSSIDLLGIELRRMGAPADFVKTVIAAGDVVTESSRKLCLEVFGVPLRQLYSACETGIMSADGTTDEDGQYPVYDLGYIEFLDKNDQPVSEGIPGRVIASRLFSAAMPILRYDIGDSAVFRNLTEPDGTPGYRIIKVHGRNDEILTLPDGRMLSLPMVYHIFNDRLEVQQFRIVQKARSFFRIYIAATEPNYASVQPALQKKLDELFLGSARYDMIRVDMIPPDTIGKFSAIVPLKGRRKTPEGALSCQSRPNDQEQ